MVLSLSVVVLLGGLVVVLCRYAGLRTWHAVTCSLFGFFVASTSAAPYGRPVRPRRRRRRRPLPRWDPPVTRDSGLLELAERFVQLDLRDVTARHGLRDAAPLTAAEHLDL